VCDKCHQRERSVRKNERESERGHQRERVLKCVWDKKKREGGIKSAKGRERVVEAINERQYEPVWYRKGESEG
jgi:hypothetical protein